jgi:carboxypeptidase PM20D1
MLTVPLVAISLLLSLLVIAIVRTIAIRSATSPAVTPPQASIPRLPESDLAAKHLAEAVTFPTVTHQVWKKTDREPFLGLHRFLAETYPLVHTKLEQIDTGALNLVYRWSGTDKSLEPALLLAHQDVVPASDAEYWRYPPFSHQVHDGYVFGRGSFDAKGQMIAIYEALEALLRSGHMPRRTWYIAFGCDEEVRGTEGAAKIARYFGTRGIRFAFVLDEGGVVAKGFIPGIDRPIAVVGIAEKGDANIKISCTRDGGHSSTPANPTALGILGAAIWRLESGKQAPVVTTPVRMMLHTLGQYAPFPLAVLFLNLWLFKPVVFLLFGANPTMNALVRSTCTVTMAHGSDAPNVVAKQAEAMVNVRLLPEESTERTYRWMAKRIRDKRVTMDVVADAVRSKVSRLDDSSFANLSEAIRTTFPEAIPTPYLMTGGTDALWYEQLSDHVFRFTPATMDSGELKRMHSRDERFSIGNLGKAMEFYMTLITQDSRKV